MTIKRHDSAKSRTAMLVWVAVILSTMLPWNTWGANPLPLGQIPVPEPPNLAQFVKDKAAAIRLGKALFWDMQAGSDGIQACASCHYRAGADPIAVRSKNQLAPRASASGTSILQVKGANSILAEADFPFFQVTPVDAQIGTGTVLSNVHDIAGSQGVRLAKFEGVILGSPVDKSSTLVDPTFISGGINVRQVTGRNAPTTLNAVFNYANFWDGRASNIFNGSSPLGPLDVAAGIWIDNGGAKLAPQQITISNASLASQAVGPPLSDVEMSFRGRTFPELGRKMLSLTPLGQQTVHPADSVLGALSNAAIQYDGTLGGVKGINTTYIQMIKNAFQDNYWSSAKLTSGNFTQMEANFSLFWGLAIQLYEATLVSDQTPFDKYLTGDTAAMSAAARNGFTIFSSQCAKCHSGSELTSASVSNAQAVIADTGTLIEEGSTGVNGSVSDIGFYNIGMRPTADDPGRGAGLPGFPFPLSFAAQSVANASVTGSIPFTTFPLPNGATAASPVAVGGAFKMPGLRNVELTPPYWHNGGALTLEEAVEFYARGGNFANAEMDADMKPIGTLGNATQRGEVVEFLKALTDERVRNESAPFDHPELLLPQGDPELPMTRLLAKGISGDSALLPPLTMTVTSPTNQASQTISGTLEKSGEDVMAAPQVTVNGATPAAATVSADGKTWSYHVTGLVQDTNTVSATAIDLAGVTRTITNTILAGLSQPVGTIVININAAITNSPLVSLTLTAAGPNPVDYMQFSSDGWSFYAYEPFFGTRNMTLPSGDGTKTIYVKFKDRAGKESNVYSSAITLDTVPPDLTITTPVPTREAYQTMHGTVEAGITPVVAVGAAGETYPVTVSVNSWNCRIDGLKEGNNSIKVTATDKAGNVTVKTAIVIRDTIEPYLNIDTILGTKGTGKAIAGTAEVGSKITVKCDYVSADVVFFDDLLANYTRWSAMILGLVEGHNYCKVTATDAAGNYNTKQVDIFRDDIPPDLEIFFDDLVKYGIVQTISGTVEAGVTPVMTVNGGAYAGAMTVNGSIWSCTVSGLAVGNNIITVTATDAAGNVVTKSGTVTTVTCNGSFSGKSQPDVADALKALRIAVGIEQPTPVELLRGDLFDDGKIDLSDAILILKKIVGL